MDSSGMNLKPENDEGTTTATITGRRDIVIEKLEKNSVIAVTVDDLNEGLIVVSYSNQDNLYQGVLLQLNRDRGIPSGISFPKDYCTGSVVEPNGENNDPTQVPPLPQRHTYFQDKEGSVMDTGLKSRLALRRVIKPPARFKNARMALRLRSRPVLCAKCRTLCEDKDKASSQSADPADESEPQSRKVGSTTSNNSTAGAITTTLPGGVTTRRGKSTVGVTPGTASLISSSSNSCSSEADPAQEDYSFLSVGSRGVVENYWKRPSLIPEPETEKPVGRGVGPLSSSSSGQSGSSSNSSYNKSMEPFVVLNKSSSPSVPPKLSKISSVVMSDHNKLTLTLTKDNNNRVLPKLVVSSLHPPPGVLRTGFEKKAERVKKSSKGARASKKLLTKLSNSSTKNNKKVDPLRDSPSDIITKATNTAATHPDGALDPSSTSSPEGKEGETNFKMWENRIRKKSAVPSRFRDEGYVTKNIFSFKRRRLEDEIVVAAENNPECVSPEHLNRSVSSTESGDREVVVVPSITKELSPPDPTLSSSSLTERIIPPVVIPLTLLSAPPVVSSSSKTNGHSADNSCSSNSSKPESGNNKTPVIKISFGTPGNGVVVEIPPKAKQEDPVLPTDKAARKAMKKAKKEARRKLSLSRDPSPSSKQQQQLPLLLTRTPSPPPLPPPLNPQNFSPVTPALLLDEPDSNSLPEHKSLSPDVNPLDPYHVIKKKKKEKKKKRSKPTKDNGEQPFGLGSDSSPPPLALEKDPLEITPSSRTSPMPSTTSSDPPVPSIPLIRIAIPHSTSSPPPEPPPLALNEDGDEEDHTIIVPADVDEEEEDNNAFALDPGSRSSVTGSDAADGPPQRLCISLKRLNDSSMVSWDITQSCITCSQSSSSNSNNDSTISNSNNNGNNEFESSSEPPGSPASSEPNDYPVNESSSPNGSGSGGTSCDPGIDSNASSIDSYTDECRNYIFKKGDIVWGKLSGCPWWPAKILDILYVDVEDVTARVSWYRAATMSNVRFSQLSPFAEQFEMRYARSRKRGSYQHAVRDALIEAHQLDPNDLPSD